MRVYRLKGGQYAYGGHVVNILQDVTGFTTSLPRLAADIPVLVVRRQGGEAKSHKDFVAQNHLQKHVIILCSFFLFKPRLIRTQLTIVTNIIERVFVATAILS